MTEKSNPNETPELQVDGSESAPAAEYKVGPGRPPQDTRWKKGGSSPNPRGRPRKEKSRLPDLTEAFERAMKKKVRVSRGTRKNSMTRGEIALEQHFNQAAKGDRHSFNVLLKLAEKAGIDIFGNQRKATEEPILPGHELLLARYVERQTRAAQIVPAERVLAPPELLDDDLDETKQPEGSRASPATAPLTPEPARQPDAKGTTKEKGKEEVNHMQPAQPLDQASYGAGRPPPGGFSVTTGKPT